MFLTEQIPGFRFSWGLLFVCVSVCLLTDVMFVDMTKRIKRIAAGMMIMSIL